MAECICKASGLGECLFEDTPKATPTDECDDASCSACAQQLPPGEWVAFGPEPKVGAGWQTTVDWMGLGPVPGKDWPEGYVPGFIGGRPTQKPKADSAQAAEMLTRSAELLAERGKRYDKADGTSSMDRAVAALNTITGHNLTEDEGWMLMLLLKLSRATAKAGYHADSYEDAAAFVGLMAVARSKREEGK